MHSATSTSFTNYTKIIGNVVHMSGQQLCILSVASPLLKGRSIYFSGFLKNQSVYSLANYGSIVCGGMFSLA